MGKQLIIIADMEGASGIFENNRKAMVHGSDEWTAYWEAPDVEIGLEIFNYVRELIVKVD